MTLTPKHRLSAVVNGLCAAIVLSTSSGVVLAQAHPPATDDTIRNFVSRQSTAGVGRLEVKVGQLDARLQLAPCASVEPYLPPGVRLWGRTSIGLRCIEGAKWNVLLPITVSVYGTALVAQRALVAGELARAVDFMPAETELTREPTLPIRDAAILNGQVLTRPLSAGQILRAEHLRQPALLSAGDPVKVRLLGDGFAVNAEGVAMAPGLLGQALRVRMESGKIINGIVRESFIEMRL
jgi:flagellar basal body P-ring formation protein FlgA